MKTGLDTPFDQLNDHEQNIVTAIKKHGWFNTRVFDHEGKLPDFSYSTGFCSSLDFPEIIVFSLPKDTTHSILWDVYRDVASGKKLLVGVATPDIFGNANAFLLPVAKRHYDEHLGSSQWFYRGDEFPCLQLIWPDPNGYFPWEPEIGENFKDSQPDLTEHGWSVSIAK